MILFMICNIKHTLNRFFYTRKKNYCYTILFYIFNNFDKICCRFVSVRNVLNI